MIPTLYGDDLTADFTLRTQPTRTYRLNFGGKPSTGMLDGQEAMKQTIFMILHSERYAHEIFSWNYGGAGQPDWAGKHTAFGKPDPAVNLGSTLAG